MPDIVGAPIGCRTLSHKYIFYAIPTNTIDVANGRSLLDSESLAVASCHSAPDVRPVRFLPLVARLNESTEKFCLLLVAWLRQRRSPASVAPPPLSDSWARCREPARALYHPFPTPDMHRSRGPPPRSFPGPRSGGMAQLPCPPPSPRHRQGAGLPPTRLSRPTSRFAGSSACPPRPYQTSHEPGDPLMGI